MKKPLIPHLQLLAALSVAAAVSCARPLADIDLDAPTGTGPLVEVLFSASDGTEGPASTRATLILPENEQHIARWAVFAFDRESPWFAYATSSSGAGVSLRLRAGRRYSCYAIANYPTSGAGAFNPASVRAPEDLTGKVAYLSDNTATSLLMFGTDEVTPSASAYDPARGDALPSEEKTIGVTRLVSRIDVSGIRVDFSGKPHLAGKAFVLRHIYVTNTYRTTRYSSDYTFSELSASRGAWYNTMGWHRGESPDGGMDALTADRGIDAPLSGSVTHATPHSFYVFPNPTPRSADNHDISEWTRRSTRVILEATLGGDTVYYQVNLPAMQRNHIYSAQNIVIRGRGSNDPELLDFDPDVIDLSLVIDDDWNAGEDINL